MKKKMDHPPASTLDNRSCERMSPVIGLADIGPTFFHSDVGTVFVDELSGTKYVI